MEEGPTIIAMERYITTYPRGWARAGEDDRPTGQINVMTTLDGQSTMEQPSDLAQVCRCGKKCKNDKDLKIHQTKMKCLQPESNVQRTRQPGESEERLGQDTNHSAQNPQAQDEEGGRSSIAGVRQQG